MKPRTPLEEANQIIVQRFIRQYLSPKGASVRTIEGACVEMRQIGNRYGIVPDASTYRYEVTHPDLGFGFTTRAVWRCGDLMHPLAVHTVIEDYNDLGGHGSDDAVRLVANDWLQGLV